MRDRQTDRQIVRQRELESEGVIGRRIVALGKKEIMNYRLNGQRQKECIGRERERDRLTDGQTDRQTELESEGVIERGIVPLGKKKINEL